MDYIKRSEATSSKICEGISCSKCPFNLENGIGCRIDIYLSTLPAADVIERDCATIDGYSVEYLTDVARLAAANNISAEHAIKQIADIKTMAKVLSEDMKKTLEDALRRAVCTQ